METESSDFFIDHFIPELFYDYFYILAGAASYTDSHGNEILLSQQTLKTIHTSRLTFAFSTPLILFGARLSLRFAETYWEKEIFSNTFLHQNWVRESIDNLAGFSSQVIAAIQKHRNDKTVAPMLTQGLKESEWLRHFSPRHKRRLYQNVFGLSRKEMQAIQNIHSFLEQTCDFASENPRIIQHLNPEVFYDQPHLNHAFKKMTRLSPLEYFEASSILQDNLMAASYNEVEN